MNQYLESKYPRRKRDNQGNLIDSLEKKTFLFPSSVKFVQEIRDKVVLSKTVLSNFRPKQVNE